MPAETSDNPFAHPSQLPTPQPERGQGWIGWSLAGGVVLGLPIGWLLAYLGALPAFLGLFFDLLLGLIIGATMYRLGRRAAPVPRGHLWAIGGVVAGLVWLTMLVAQYHWFPDDAARMTLNNSISYSMSLADVQKFEADTRQYALGQLREHYPPGGFLGYIHWAATNRRMDIPRPGGEPPFQYHIPGKAIIWHIQIFLSLAFLLFAIESQILGLSRVEGPREPIEADGQPDQPDSAR
jgi:hypothetical protein